MDDTAPPYHSLWRRHAASRGFTGEVLFSPDSIESCAIGYVIQSPLVRNVAGTGTQYIKPDNDVKDGVTYGRLNVPSIRAGGMGSHSHHYRQHCARRKPAGI